MSKRDFFKKIWSMCYLSTGGALAYGGLSIYNNNEKFYGDVLMPLIRYIDPETSHNLAVKALKYELIPKSKYVDDPVLKTSFFGKELSNPIGIAAGFDKQGEAVSGLKKIGFGIVEIGSVTPEPQSGNPKPRVFRLSEDEAIINRYGFNSSGHTQVLQNLEKIDAEKWHDSILGVNLGKNKDSLDATEDYIKGLKLFSTVADYLVINISSPNTAGLRELQKKDHLYQFLKGIVSARNSMETEKKPLLLLKLSPDLSNDEKNDIVNILNKKECKIDGLIISNTTLQRSNLTSTEFVEETGGLSGKPLKDISTNMIRDMYKLTKGKVPIIGVGGVSSGRDAFEKILAGATVVQLYSSFAYEGPPIVSRIKSELSECLLNDGYTCVNDAVGKEIATGNKKSGFFRFF
ncbi:dihydroorotate dehydrogenase 2 [Arctopsyche grandis]|uniref:dihydroorotate dehydrogenase 2 n=1 Tax=Arctopsyche grandis TaxID=121162 RepID=UPI00406D6F5F